MSVTRAESHNERGFIFNLPRRFGRGLIRIYRYTLSPFIGWRCRHLPTCSEYGDEAIARPFALALRLGQFARAH